MEKTYTDAQAKDMRQKLNELNTKVSKATLELAELLYNVYHGVVQHNNQTTPLIQTWGFDTFEQYAEESVRNGGLDMHFGRAKRLVAVHDEFFVKRDLPEGTIGQLQITKLFRLVDVAKAAKDLGTLKKWIGKAHEMTCCEFEEAVGEEFAGGTKFKSFRLSLKPSQMVKFNKNLSQARDMLGGETKGQTMLKVLEEWLATASDKVRPKRTA